MANGGTPSQLFDLAAGFASDLTTRLQRILDTDAQFTAFAFGRGRSKRAKVGQLRLYIDPPK